MHTASSLPYQGSLPGQRRLWTDPSYRDWYLPCGQTPVEMLPCSKRHLRAVIKSETLDTVTFFRILWCIPPTLYRTKGVSLDRDPSGQRPPVQKLPQTETPWTETPWTEIPPDIYRDPPMDRPTSVKILPCPKLHLRAVIKSETLDTVAFGRILWCSCRVLFMLTALRSDTTEAPIDSAELILLNTVSSHVREILWNSWSFLLTVVYSKRSTAKLIRLELECNLMFRNCRHKLWHK